MSDDAEPPDFNQAALTVLTTEHYNLQTQRASTVSESIGRASMFLGSVSAGLIAIGFRGSTNRTGAATVIFGALVLTTLAFLGVATFVRCVEIAIDDWSCGRRIQSLRNAYIGLVPAVASQLAAVAAVEQAIAMLTPRRQRWQVVATVAGAVGVITGVLVGADVGLVIDGTTGTIGLGLGAGVAAGTAATALLLRFQQARWTGAPIDAPA